MPTFDYMVMTFFFVSLSVIHYDKPTEALEAIQERKARLDLVLTDVYMPEVNRFQFMNCLEKEFNFPVICKYNFSFAYIYYIG